MDQQGFFTRWPICKEKGSTNSTGFEIIESDVYSWSLLMQEKAGVEIERADSIATVRFPSTSISNAEDITYASEQIKSFIDDNRPSGLLFDFEGVKFFCSQVLGLLLDIRAKMQTHNGKVVISAVTPQLYRVFKITNLHEIFEFFPDRESAMQELRTKQP
jgi:anti-anti-sigma factor